MTKPELEWVTVDDAAALAGVHRATMWRWIRSAEASLGRKLVTKRATGGKKRSGLRTLDLRIVAAYSGSDPWQVPEVADMANEIVEIRARQAGITGTLAKLARALGLDT